MQILKSPLKCRQRNIFSLIFKLSEIVKNTNKNFKNRFHSVNRPKKTFEFC